MAKRLVMLKGNWPAPVFRRSVRDRKGKVVGRLEFTKSEPVALTAAQFEAVAKDVGPALVEVVADEAKPRWRPADWVPPADREPDADSADDQDDAGETPNDDGDDSGGADSGD